MHKLKKVSLYVWIGTSILFFPLSVVNTLIVHYVPSYINFANVINYVTIIYFTDIIVGVFSFVVLVFTDFIIKVRKNPRVLIRLVLLIGVFIGLLLLLITILPHDVLLTETSNLTINQPASYQNDMETTQEEPLNSDVDQTQGVHGYLKEPIVNLKYEYYTVRGRTREELCDSVQKWQEDNDKGRALAHINYSLKYEYYPAYTNRGYTIGSYKVITDSVITLPKWESSLGASEGTKSDWRKFKLAVESHEREHHDILLKYAQKLVDIYNKLGYYPSEEALDAKIQAEYKEIYKRLDKAQEDFDKKYGESQSYTYLCR